uniref:Cytochrome b5 domain-containing protein 1 n=1 Tax=Timema poppense TaxID=170557 RepID=A0A7R9CP46_TIMPO|nr:unnamed protein product [Timema poppensis]
MAVTARRYYTPAEVVVHNTPNDLWVSFLGRVLDLTSLAQEYDGTQEIKPILAHAGKDISHWFDPRTGESEKCGRYMAGEWRMFSRDLKGFVRSGNDFRAQLKGSECFGRIFRVDFDEKCARSPGKYSYSTPPSDITEHEEIWQLMTQRERERSKIKLFSIKTLCKLIFLTQLKHRIHPVTGVRVPYTPHGPIPHVSLEVPNPLWRLVGVPWWVDPKYVIGFLTEKARPVCKEDKLTRILERFLPFNSHASSYTFKFETRVLDMNKTLEENDIPDERELFLDLGLEDNFYIPALMIYFNDDLTEM